MTSSERGSQGPGAPSLLLPRARISPSALTVQIHPFSRCAKRHDKAALKAQRCDTAAEINLPKCRVRELVMKKS